MPDNNQTATHGVNHAMSSSPEIGLSIDVDGFTTNYHDHGDGETVVLIHGSGPGVSAFANWRLVIPELAQYYRVLAPDMFGFGFSARPQGLQYTLPVWLEHIVGFLDALKLERVHLVGNSFGGALSLALTIAHPERVGCLTLMGAAGLEFDLTEGLDKVWGYTPSFENMRELLDLFAYGRNLVNDELAQLRYEASNREGVQEAYAEMFPAPRQNGIKSLASTEADIAQIEQPTSIIHGREDRIIPPACAERLFKLIPDAELHMFGRCGHWTQIERAAAFCELVHQHIQK